MRWLILALSLGLTLCLAGCGGQPASPLLPETSAADPTDVPAEVQELLDIYAPADDESSVQAVMSNLDSLPYELLDSCDVYSVTFLWGDLFNTAEVNPDTIDWSGTLSIENGTGVVHVRCAIDFEPGQDSVLIHDNPTFAIWISKTHADFDGLSFLVFIKWFSFEPALAAPMLKFETAPVTLQFRFHQLVKLDAFYGIPGVGGIAIHSRRIWQNSCPGGLIEGIWHKDGSWVSSGRFDGYWLDHRGNKLGILTGRYWMDANAYPGKLEGWVSGIVTDEVIAELKGFWYYDDYRLCPMCGAGHGVFYGTFVYLSNSKSGRFIGEFGDYSLPPDDVEMPMHGIWYFECPWTVTVGPSD
jgi:hypothetical protein